MVKQSSRRFNPAVRNAPAFAKRKVKVGRQLRHDNATNTSVSAKRIVIMEQLKTDQQQQQQTSAGNSSTPQLQQHRKSLDELVTQLGHYNENICRDAIHGVRLQFKDSPDQIRKHLRIVIPGVGSLLVRELKATATRNQLKRLIEQVCETPGEVISSHFNLFCTYVLTGISDVRPVVRALCFDVLVLLLKKYPDLCRQNHELFNAFLQLLEGQRKPENRTKLLDSIGYFVTVYGRFTENKLWPERTLQISFDTNKPIPPCPLLPSAAYFHFPVLYPDTVCGGQSPLLAPDGIVHCCRVLCPLLEAIIRAEEDDQSASFNSTMSKAHSAISALLDFVLRLLDQQTDSAAAELRAQLVSRFASLRRCPLIKASKKLAAKMDLLATNG